MNASFNVHGIERVTTRLKRFADGEFARTLELECRDVFGNPSRNVITIHAKTAAALVLQTAGPPDEEDDDDDEIVYGGEGGDASMFPTPLVDVTPVTRIVTQS